ncbi:hypothetical protein DDP54_15725 (plasmid) [Cellulomonas sp. WB94]|uniref:hypothetical protein n=1 Tax=Cellulomonas sp. WB94 TaxID=2173174 RepID=UPI000D56557C|nr:hypothetical protein [Cellulomonas sp. WB94]PVU81349.1 hypothetical protein DDP54_15725 [Cellulomonas sp. WB94]
MSAPFEARFAGLCAECDRRILPGDLVRFQDDELVHDDHANDPPATRPDGPVCPRCWLTRPCEHDDDFKLIVPNPLGGAS